MCPLRWKSLAAVGKVTDILKVLWNHVCYNTQAMPKFQVMNSLYVTLLTPGFLLLPQGFCKICGLQPYFVHVYRPFRITCENNMLPFIVCWLILCSKCLKSLTFLNFWRNVAECISCSLCCIWRCGYKKNCGIPIHSSKQQLFKWSEFLFNVYIAIKIIVLSQYILMYNLFLPGYCEWATACTECWMQIFLW